MHDVVWDGQPTNSIIILSAYARHVYFCAIEVWGREPVKPSSILSFWVYKQLRFHRQ